MKKLIQLSATPALMAGMTALSPGAADAQSLLDDMNFYVGATGGYLSGEAEHRYSPNDVSIETDEDIGILSAIVGIDTRSDGWLFGIEGDIGLPLGDFGDNDLPPGFQWSDMNYNAHLRARAGRSFGSADVFIAAGLAIAEFENENNSQTESDDFTLTGFSIGAGVDWPVTERLKARVEILHDDYGRKSTVQDNYSGDWTDTTLRGGLLFQF